MFNLTNNTFGTGNGEYYIQFAHLFVIYKEKLRDHVSILVIPVLNESFLFRKEKETLSTEQ